jgi:hypothetical protein
MGSKQEGLIIFTFRRHTLETSIFRDPLERHPEEDTPVHQTDPYFSYHSLLNKNITWKDIHALLEEGANPLVVHDIVTHRKKDQFRDRYNELCRNGVHLPRPRTFARGEFFPLHNKEDQLRKLYAIAISLMATPVRPTKKEGLTRDPSAIDN